MISKLDVLIWGKKAGTLIESKEGYRNRICFYFDPDFVKSGQDIAPLRSPINGAVAQNGLPVYPETDKLFGGLPSFIADSLPDHWGNIVFNEWAKANHIPKRELGPLDRLAYIGRRGMGALEFVPPAAEKFEEPFKLEISDLYALAQKALNDARGFHAVISPDLMIESLFKVGTSAGGKRPKAVINLNTDTMECYSGQVPAPIAGFTPMIIKFDEHSDIPTTRIEYSYWLMAKDADLGMMPSRLLEGSEQTHFLTERFDRKEGEKVHVQTLAALSPSANSYEDLFEVAVRLGVTPSELQRLFRQMVMNVIAGNVDDHSKNFSFMMERDGKWRLAPAYDFTFTVDVSAPYYVNTHSLSVNGKRDGIAKADLLSVARRFCIKSAESTISKMVEVAKGYREYGESSGVPDFWIKRIDEEISSICSNNM